jgi:hypothetical protein
MTAGPGTSEFGCRRDIADLSAFFAINLYYRFNFMEYFVTELCPQLLISVTHKECEIHENIQEDNTCNHKTMIVLIFNSETCIVHEGSKEGENCQDS